LKSALIQQQKRFAAQLAKQEQQMGALAAGLEKVRAQLVARKSSLVDSN
jgi:hypothetical protein